MIRWFAALAAFGLLLPGPAVAGAGDELPLVPLPSRPDIRPKMDCAALERIDFSRGLEAPVRILQARLESATDDAPESCVVRGYVAPQTQFLLKLPTRGYSGRYLQSGCGGNCGSVASGFAEQRFACTAAQTATGAFATSFNNEGHFGAVTDSLWSFGAPELREQFTGRATHLSAIANKAIIAAYYGEAPAYSYFYGCSGGGREAMIEAQRHPEDFNGVVAGAIPFRFITKTLRIMWDQAVGLSADGRPIIDAPAAQALHRAVMKRCDAIDGLADGLISTPRACRFDPQTIVCGPAKTTDCISTEQAEAARRLYQGPVGHAGERLWFGGRPYGSELDWPKSAFILQGRQMGGDVVRFLLEDASFDANRIDFSADLAKRMMTAGEQFSTDVADLSGFDRAGGKIIMWQGEADYSAGSYGLLDYYQRLRDAAGGLSRTKSFARVFMIPGLDHCGRGYQESQTDFLGAVVNWVESGKAPDAVIAKSRLADGRVRTRPIYPYPTAAKYRGGSIDDAASFAPRDPRAEPNDRFNWVDAARR